MISLEPYQRLVAKTNPLRCVGRVTKVVGLTVEVAGLNVPVGELCLIENKGSGQVVQAEIKGFRDHTSLLMPLGELEGIGPGCPVLPTGRYHTVAVGLELLGRVVDGLGQPMDGRELVTSGGNYPVDNHPPDPLARQRINTILPTGVRAIDAFLTLGRGQRIGIFAGSGVGKSTLMGMIARNSEAEINVIGLIGERGREVLDFLERDLGPAGLARSVVVVATSDQPALVRIKGAFVATAIAEYFRDQGRHVMLMMDSLTRFAMAQREVGLAIGEPPTSRGYTPSVFALLPRLLERAGNTRTGSITGLYAVLVDGDDLTEPITDAVRAIVDGHIVLSRKLGDRNHYPAIDILASVSRLMPDITSKEHQDLAAQVRDSLAAYQSAEDLINIGAYQAGNNPRVDAALKYYEPIMTFLKQDVEVYSSFAGTIGELQKLFN
ncbi:MAG: flagellar protein export ATPase FliI [Clostridia bacterium]|nr:MAG: flagellar protein export ATPase FliI [Clostridia bacterium]